MRRDALGFFWEDMPEVKVLKEKIKRTPPERTWERDDYLPNLQEAMSFGVNAYTDDELVRAWARGERLIFDIESYPNYFLVAFKGIDSGKVVYFERGNEEDHECTLDFAKLKWIIEHFTLVGFNSWSYDLPILSLAMGGKNAAQMKMATDEIILNDARGTDIVRGWGCKMLNPDHIDLIEVAPLRASLKIYAGRLHAPRMQDLPFPPGKHLNAQQMTIVRWYCVNDLQNTEILYRKLREQLELREAMSGEFASDLRSRSDAQIAERVIVKQVEKINKKRVVRRPVEPGYAFNYQVPNFLRYESELMNWVLGVVANAQFIVSEHGNVPLPTELANLEVALAGGVYRMGVGGLHSSEQSAAHVAGDGYRLYDRDVTSFYPKIILNQGLYPSQLGPAFLEVYQRIVDRRIAAKVRGDKVTADSLKITINGSFGKFGNAFSFLYAPELLIQTTITGQLVLLMLIERLEMRGIHVVSANTDGLVIKCHDTQRADMLAVIAKWEHDTNFETEETQYRALYSKDVNNYIAVKPDGQTKRKGVYAATDLHKNPASEICVTAAVDLISKGVPIDHTIRACTDVRQFVSVRNVKGGAVKDGEYLGKSIRWYYAAEEPGEIIYASSGNKVPRSEGARPLMLLPEALPPDVDYARYEADTQRILNDIAYAVCA